MDFLTTPTFGTFIELETERDLMDKSKAGKTSASKAAESTMAGLKEMDLSAEVIDEAGNE